ncbi:altered inheritance of mitochondria protein 36, mitochondrial [Scheffersomyces xylosifermentans]|uniref:altered inheritance of mitochondria protein 36, mitochondrial n=1 Tax=Scheffersomyces xylosifermentans TaxID=1304137 RepID=UPI00315DAE93
MFTRGFIQRNINSRALLTKNSTSTVFAQPKPSVLLASRNYAFSSNRRNQPRIRYLFYVFGFSTVLLYYVGNVVDKKKPKTSFDSEREFQEYEKITGLKRRYKLINHDKNEHYKFYVVPYVHSDASLEKIADRLKKRDETWQVKIIDPVELIEKEKQDEGKKYCYLLQDIAQTGRPYPKGLITALVKEEIEFFMNTRSGTFDTNFIIKNYPQTTDEAIKFENDVSDIQKCLVLNYDIVNELPKAKNPDVVRSINNVKGYFETVGRTIAIDKKHDELDSKLLEIILKDI